MKSKMNPCVIFRQALIAVVIGCAPAWALSESSLGFDVLGGIGTDGYGINGNLGLPSNDASASTQLSLSYAYQYTTVETPSRTNQYTFGLAHTVDDSLEGHGTVTSWDDSLNDIHYAGPSFGFTYTWNEAGDSGVKEPSGDEIASLSLNSDLFLYETDVIASSTTRKVFNAVLKKYVTTVIPAGTPSANTTQFHPSLTFEVPLFEQVATPYLTYGHYFYSQNPDILENLVGRPRFSGSANQLNGLVGGFLNNNAEIGIRFSLPADFQLTPRFGTEQLATDNTWAITQGVELDWTFWKHWTSKLEWARSIEEGVSLDVFTGGLTYAF
jgi:hypothetical protein